MFGARLTELRLARKLNKAKLARMVGVSDVTISYWESGKIKSLTRENLMSLAGALDMLVSEIIDDPMLPQYRADLAKKAIEAVAEGEQGKFAPVEAINFSLTLIDPKPFLAAWQASEWDLIREKWPEAPLAIYPETKTFGHEVGVNAA